MPAYEKLKYNRDFARVYRRGQNSAGRWVIVHKLQRKGKHKQGPARVGFAVVKKTRSAVRRNRMKRVLRESFRLAPWQLVAGVDIILTARWRDNEPEAEVLRRDMARQLKSLGLIAEFEAEGEVTDTRAEPEV